ncbi:pro-thyrotropin-releasing hormone-A-like [Oncorhynchus tshawytscha]|uniref:Pro-thyrotropin-releasing hormone n=1 Tax=Oncorhynchus tshawytscha TaxID=74940 RepID=A0A8C8CKV9_ONCTS|nr:pro-thyrotropin-releasing hormone-A-like [Oncorhynchus tshawytscha]
MKSTFLIILASLAVCNLTVARGQSIPDQEKTGDRQIDDIVLQRAEGILLRSILKMTEDEDGVNEALSSQPEWLVKRQHPGKREEDEDEDEDSGEVQKRQHPGKREDEIDSFVGLQKTQHPGKRSMLEQITENSAFLSELSKRQHPGKRYLMMYSKRQHPGRRDVDDESDAGDLQELEKRQHPGKRYWYNMSPELGANSPCDVLDPGCSKANLLLELLDNVTKSRAAEKRQHPGKRSAPDEDLTERE